MTLAISFFKSLRKHFQKTYGDDFEIGKLYLGSSEFSYFSLTPPRLKKVKLKFVIVLNIKHNQIEICLSGQNKAIRKEVWESFKGSDWVKYRLVDSIDESLAIIDHVMISKPDYADEKVLLKRIEIESFEFMEELRKILE